MHQSLGRILAQSDLESSAHRLHELAQDLTLSRPWLLPVSVLL